MNKFNRYYNKFNKKIDDNKRANATVSLLNKSQPIFKKLLSKNGINDFRIITMWNQIVGEELSLVSRPKKITYKRGSRSNAILQISVVGAYATEISYMDGLIIERINSFMGYCAISLIRIHQDFNVSVDEIKLKKNDPKIQGSCEKLDNMLSNIQDKELKKTLKNLGRHIIKEEK